MDPHNWRSYWHSWGMLKTHESWFLDMPWYAILMTFYLRGVIPPACSKSVRLLSSASPFISDGLSGLARPILWRLPNTGIILVELFRGIDTGLAAVLEVGLTITRYVYMDNSQVSTHVPRHHLHQLMVL